MSIYTKLLTLFLSIALLSLTACGEVNPKQSMTDSVGHSAMNHNDMAGMTNSGAMSAMAMGRVISTDLANGLVTIEHGPIKVLDWPTMTMPFMADTKLLSSVKVGDFVDMSMMTKPNKDGKYVLTNISTMHVDRSKLSADCLSKMDNIKSLDHGCMSAIKEAVPHKH